MACGAPVRLRQVAVAACLGLGLLRPGMGCHLEDTPGDGPKDFMRQLQGALLEVAMTLDSCSHWMMMLGQPRKDLGTYIWFNELFRGRGT